MHIAITLPLHLWKQIAIGQKTIELRKTFPQNFNYRSAVVYVCEEGSDNVLGYFSVKRFEYITPKILMNSLLIMMQIGVPAQFLETYAGNSVYLCLWHIKTAREFKFPMNRNSYLNLSRNPQSIVYVR